MKQTYLKIIISFLIIIISISVLVISTVAYYFYPRSVNFEIVEELDIPHPDFDLYDFIGFHKAEDKDRLDFWLLEFTAQHNHPEWSCDSLYVEKIAAGLDFQKYDYLIAYQKQLLGLHHSPFITKTKDDLYFDKRIPLFATWDTTRTEKIYIYRIRKNKRFRSIGP